MGFYGYVAPTIFDTDAGMAMAMAIAQVLKNSWWPKMDAIDPETNSNAQDKD